MLVRCIFAAALALQAAAAAPAPDRPANRVVNPSLEDPLSANGLPQGWNAWTDPGGAYQVSAADGGHTGGKALLVEGDGKYGGATTTRIPVEPGKHYLVRGWVKLEGERGAVAVVKLDYMKANGQYLGEVRMGEVAAGQEGWRCLSVAAHSGDVPGAEVVAAAVSLTGKGKASFDDLELTATDPARPNGDLLVNGTMEEAAGDQPAYWFLSTAPNARVALATADEGAKEGERCLCIKGRAPYAVAVGERYRLEPGRAYSFAGFVRVKAGQASIKIDYYRGVEYLGCTEAPPVRGNAWEQRTVATDRAKFPNATHIAPGGVAFGGNVEAYFDDLALVAQ